MKTFMKYMALQIPGWALVGLLLVWLWPKTGWNPRLAAIGYAVYILKDFLLYPFFRSAYEGEAPTGGAQLIGTAGVAEQDLDPYGYIAVAGERWKAEVAPLEGRIPRGTPVRIEGAAGLTLRVAAISCQAEKPVA
jgi:membrane protein implicated in regulation of membrane protease activity